jgi:hypothetical protein
MDWNGHKVYGHDGSTLGQGGFLRILPEAGLSVALLTNGGHMRELFQDLFTEVFSELAGVEMPDWPTPAEAPTDLDASAYVGLYVREGIEMTITAEAPDLKLSVRGTGALAEAMGDKEPTVMTLRRVDGDVFVAREKADEPWAPAVFFSLPDGRRYLHLGVRATPRVG